MGIQTRKIEFVQAFLKIQNENLIAQFERLLDSNKKQSQEEKITPFSLEVFNEKIDKSLEDSKNDRLTKSSDLISEIQKW